MSPPLEQLKSWLVEFSLVCCEKRIESNPPLFRVLVQKFAEAWNYFQGKPDKSGDISFVKMCLRDLLLAQTLESDNQAFELVHAENTPALTRQVTFKKWRYQQVVGKNAQPEEVVHEFYAEMTASKTWRVFKGFSKLGAWLPLYLRAFLRDAMLQGMKDSEESESVNKRDRRFTSLAEDHADQVEAEADPQKQLALKTLRNLIQKSFSRFSAEELQFLCLLRAKRSEGIPQREVATQMGIAEYKLTRMKNDIHKRFAEHLHAEIREQFPHVSTDTLGFTVVLEDVLHLIEE